MKIHVTGNAGSGKSTVSRLISEAFELPLYGLDEIVWKENWKETPAKERSARVLHIVSKPEWVIDGVSKESRESADLVIFIDRNPVVCALRAIKRNIPYLFKPRPGFPAGCCEYRIFPYLMKLIFDFNRHVRPRILSDIVNCRYVILKSDSEIERFLSEIL